MDVKTQPAGSEWQRVLQDLSSMRTGLLLMGLIAAIALVATIAFPQADVFHSAWFRGLLTLFCANMAFCTLRQYKRMVTLSRTIPALPPAQRPERQWSAAVGKADLEQFLADRGYRYRSEVTANGLTIYADKGLAGRWGALGVHLAILMIAFGALVGNVFGFTQSVQVGKNETIQLPLNKAATEYAELLLKDFRIEYYPDGSVSEYISDVTITGAAAQAERAIKINHPLDFQGITVYQMDYGYQVLAQTHRPDGTVASSAWLKSGGTMMIDQEKDISLQVINYIPDFNPRRPAVTLSPFPNNPKVLYAFYQKGEAIDWGVADFNQVMRLKGYDTWITFGDVRPYSILDVKSDPGVPIVMAGFLLLSAAFFFSMMLRYHQLTISTAITAKGQKTALYISRLSGEKMEQLCAELEEELLKGGKTHVNG